MGKGVVGEWGVKIELDWTSPELDVFWATADLVLA